MAETEPTAVMANMVFDKVFKRFGWQSTGLKNQNWPCVQPETHNKKTHPSDLVCWYDDPYSNVRIYTTIDLKSYGADTIQTGKLRSALQSLAISTCCANVSTEFASLYIASPKTVEIVGLMFVYNHDGEFDRNFQAMLTDADDDTIKLDVGRRLYVIGPERIAYLTSLSADLSDAVNERGGDHRFVYTDRYTRRPHERNMTAASLELLMGPWMVVHLTGKPRDGAHDNQYILYYQGAGDSIEDMYYLIEFIFRSQLLTDDATISVRLPLAGPKALLHWTRARDTFADVHAYGDIASRLERITYVPLSVRTTQFSTIELGMGHD